MIVQAIVWDLGGVLVRTEDCQPRTHLAEELSLSYDGLDRLVFNSPSARQASRGEISAGQHWLNVSQQLSWPVEKIQELQDRFWGGDRLDHTLVNFMRALKPTYAIALLSNNWSNLRQALVNEWRIADVFDEIVISAEVGLVKPEPHIYRLTQAKLGFRPERILFVDDFIENIQAARAAGWKAIHFQNSQQAITEVNALLTQN